MKKLHKWLHEQVKTWVADRLVTADQASAILARYPLPSTETPWGVIVFSCLGAVIIGLGVILLIAHNWAVIPKAAKLGIVFGSVGVLHATGLNLFVNSPRARRLGEALCLLGSMLFGAGIWLVAQIYHIEEHFPNAFLVWGLGAGLLAWAMPSIPQAILSTILLTIWGATESIGYDAPRAFAPLLVAAAFGTLAYRRKSLVLAWVLAPALLFGVAVNFPRHDAMPWLVLSTLLNLGALLIAARHLLTRYGAFPDAAGMCGFYGWTVYLVLAFLMGIPGVAREFYRWQTQHLGPAVLAYWLVPFGLCLAAWALLLRLWFARSDPRPWERPGWEILLVPLSVLLAACDRYALHLTGGWPVAGPFNLILLGLAATFLARGCREGVLGDTVLGAILLVAVAVARYFDLFESLVARGVVFLAVGGVLFAQGALYSRARKRRAEGGGA